MCRLMSRDSLYQEFGGATIACFACLYSVRFMERLSLEMTKAIYKKASRRNENFRKRAHGLNLLKTVSYMLSYGNSL
jgi:hypothetical protein